MTEDRSFFNIYNHGFVRLAVGVPRCKVADPAFNAGETVKMLTAAARRGAAVAAFPELGLAAYTCDDLFHQSALLDACEAALLKVVEATTEIPTVAIVGLPVRVDRQLFNAAAVIHRGKILGVVPKVYLPNYGEFYEARYFSPADNARSSALTICGQSVPFGAKLLFNATDHPDLKIGVEICEDVWVPVPPSSYAALAGATVLVNLSASNITIGKSSYRHTLVGSQSARCVAAYVYSSGGLGESTTDLAWDGQALIYENGELITESERFSNDSHLITGDVDLERLVRDRLRQNSFGTSTSRHHSELADYRTIDFTLGVDLSQPLPLERRLERFPYVPSDTSRRDARCEEVFNIQVTALVQRLAATGIQKLVIGVSGGLDSTHALLVCAKAMQRLGLPLSNILGFTMPGFATSRRTLDQALKLMRAVGCSAKKIDIRPSCEQMLKDLGHPYANGEPVYDITFENVQAGERTSHLFRLANHFDAIVVGTGDLSELALGWCTYGVGDHMSHYNVNASVPKTLIKHLVRWVADRGQFDAEGSQVLRNILDTQISPELVPAGVDEDGKEASIQDTEGSVGPYALQDFNLYYILRYGFAPTKVAFLSHSAWHDVEKGSWPDSADVVRTAYDLATIKKNLRIFLWRFFKTSQFKRSCVPNAPKVGSGGSLSPRGDWRAPSDSEATVWIDNLQLVPDVAPTSGQISPAE